jgi:hypothetical protein
VANSYTVSGFYPEARETASHQFLNLHTISVEISRAKAGDIFCASAVHDLEASPEAEKKSALIGDSISLYMRSIHISSLPHQ